MVNTMIRFYLRLIKLEWEIVTHGNMDKYTLPNTAYEPNREIKT